MGAFGRLFLDGEFLAYTVERPWLDNVPFESCVPAGFYYLAPFNSRTKFPSDTFALHNSDLKVHVAETGEPGERFAILIHSANQAGELAGCIALGDRLGALGGKWAVRHSRDTILEVFPKLREAGVDSLLIEWATPP